MGEAEGRTEEVAAAKLGATEAGTMRRRSTTRRPAVVDDEDVKKIADAFLATVKPGASPTVEADLIHKVVLIGNADKTAAYRRELARRVTRHVEFALMARRHQPGGGN